MQKVLPIELLFSVLFKVDDSVFTLLYLGLAPAPGGGLDNGTLDSSDCGAGL